MRSCRHFPLRTVRATFLGIIALLFLTALASPGWSRWQGAAEAGQAKKPAAATTAKLYQMRCSKCHGADGKGTEARASLPAIPDFTSAAWQQSRTDAQLTVSILDGKGVSMPAFADRLSKEEARDLVGHVRTFKPQQQVRLVKANGVDDFQQRFRALEEEFERYRKEFYDLRHAKK
jgi:mono/diheme cytochrome c family protein